MKCAECGENAVVRVRANGRPKLVCEVHRLAIVQRIAQVAHVLGRGNHDLQSILVMALDNIEFEDLPTETPANGRNEHRCLPDPRVTAAAAELLERDGAFAAVQ